MPKIAQMIAATASMGQNATWNCTVSGWPEVRECHMIRGGGDFLLRLVARDTQHENALTSKLTEAPNERVVALRPSTRWVRTLGTYRAARDVSDPAAIQPSANHEAGR